MHTPLFDRFESDDEADLEKLARDIADILGARRGYQSNLPGILSWGLPPMAGLSPTSPRDRDLVAGYVQDAIEKFEPRLENVNVIPLEGGFNFSFQLEADLVSSGNEEITLRILSPRRGGGLGADVMVIGDSR